mgnify:FL=1
MVEGWAEEILLPVIAEKMGIDLTQKEISVVNVGSTAYLHFARIFMRRNEPNMDVKCAIVTDLDVKPDDPNKSQKEETKRSNINQSLGDLPDNVSLYLAKEWTLEWCLFKSPVLSELFKDSVAAVHCRTNEFKKEGNPAQYKPEFETKLKGMLAKTNSKLDKTAVALNLTERIKTQSLDFTQNDDYIKYLLDAIRFVTH